jgi:hypothetical protein
MSHPITARIDPELAEWLERSAAESGLSQGQIVREQLRKAKGSGMGARVRNIMRIVSRTSPICV